MDDTRILFVYPYLTLGGVEMVILNRISALNQLGVPARAVFRKEYAGVVLPEGYRESIRIALTNESFQEVLRTFCPTWVIHFDTPDYLSAVYLSQPEARQVYEVHTTLAKNLTCLKDSEFLSYLTGIFVPSDYQEKIVRKMVNPDMPTYVIPNAVSEAFFLPMTANPQAKNRIVAWVGRMESHKNWMAFLEIVRYVADASPGTKFWLIGGQQSTLEQQQILWNVIKKENLTRRFRWFPAIPPAQMPEVMRYIGRSAGCLVSTSKNESFGLAVLEAMAAGCPVVVPAVGGLLDIVVDDETGYFYPPYDIQSASDLVIRIIHDPDLQKRMGDSAHRYASRFSTQETIKIFLQTLDKLEEQRMKPVH